MLLTFKYYKCILPNEEGQSQSELGNRLMMDNIIIRFNDKLSKSATTQEEDSILKLNYKASFIFSIFLIERMDEA